MIFLLRMVAVAIFAVVMFVFGCGYCLLSPRNPKNVSYLWVAIFVKWPGSSGLNWNSAMPKGPTMSAASIYIANHQNNYDLFTVSGAIMPRTVTVGKKEPCLDAVVRPAVLADR